jgi:hypothetical protein
VGARRTIDLRQHPTRKIDSTILLCDSIVAGRQGADDFVCDVAGKVVSLVDDRGPPQH